MNNIHNQLPKFGHDLQADGGVKLSWPGYPGLKKPRVDFLAPHSKTLAAIDMERQPDGDSWISSQSVKPGTRYRFWAGDWDEQTEIPARANGQAVTLKRDGHFWKLPADATASGLLELPAGSPPLHLEKTNTATGAVESTIAARPHAADQSPQYDLPDGFNAAQYRFAPSLELIESVDQKAALGQFNKVADNIAQAPLKSTVIADIYFDSLVDKARFNRLKADNNGQLPSRNHYNQFADPRGNQNALHEMIADLKGMGFTGLLFKPFIGGDNLSSHKYWTTDPFVLNNSFADKKAFRQSLAESMRHGMKLYADGAFVNQGLNGVQMLSNIQYGQASPYWNWFKYGDSPAGIKTGSDRWDYPSHAFETRKLTMGILPTVMNKTNGLKTLAYDRFDFRIQNDPTVKSTYDARKPTYLELFDPKLETRDGQKLSRAALAPDALLNSESSVQKYRFPVDPKEVIEKSKQLKRSTGKPGTDADATHDKKILMEWKTFRMGSPSNDDSSVKWDGNVNVALIDTKNTEVQNYLRDAVGYWSRMVMNTQVDTVASQLKIAANPSTQTLRAALNNATQRGNHPDDLKDARRPLPTVALPELETLTDVELATVLKASQHPDLAEKVPGEELADHILKEVPLNVLPLPETFKGTLSEPNLAKALLKPYQQGILWSAFHAVMTPIKNTHFLGIDAFAKSVEHIVEGIHAKLFPAFKQELSSKLNDAYANLRPDEQRKLQYGRVQSLVSDQLAEGLYLHLLTGLNLETLMKNGYSAKTIEDNFYKTVPFDITHADPVTAAYKLQGFLKKQLDAVPASALSHRLEDTLKTLTPVNVLLADAIVQKREYGLNWRIDAAKDVGNIDAIRNERPENRAKPFAQEIDSHVQPFWNALNKAMRAPFPKTSIIAELTDFNILTDGNKPVEKQLIDKLMNSNTFTGMPNMNFLYSGIMQLVNYAQRPDENGDTTLRPSDFIKQKLEPMSTSVNFTALKQAQNLISSHDYSTATHALMVNPDLFTADLQKWRGLSDDFRTAMQELHSKNSLQPTRDALQKAAPDLDVESFVNGLNELIADKDTLQELLEDKAETSPAYRDIAAFFDEETKGQNANDTRVATPQALKGKFIEAIFNVMDEETLAKFGLEDYAALPLEEKTAVKAVLKQAIMEPSENRAMRGVIVNAMSALDSSRFWEKQDAKVQTLKPAFKDALWRAVAHISQTKGQNFGYTALDLSLQEITNQMEKDAVWLEQSIELDAPQRRALLDSVSNALYSEANRPVMPKLLRAFAVQNALPGNPSVNLPDLFAQGGSEWTKNIFAQNRPLIRIDKRQQPEFQAFAKRVGDIFNTRSTGLRLKDGTSAGQGALNDGKILPVPGDDIHGVLPIVRDNGKEQVITLIQTGNPHAPDGSKVGTHSDAYPTVDRDLAPIHNYRSNLLNPQLTPGGRLYEDPTTHERFRLDAQGQLKNVNATGTDSGLTLQDFRILIRVPRDAE